VAASGVRRPLIPPLAHALTATVCRLPGLTRSPLSGSLLPTVERASFNLRSTARNVPDISDVCAPDAAGLRSLAIAGNPGLCEELRGRYVLQCPHLEELAMGCHSLTSLSARRLLAESSGGSRVLVCLLREPSAQARCGPHGCPAAPAARPLGPRSGAFASGGVAMGGSSARSSPLNSQHGRLHSRRSRAPISPRRACHGRTRPPQKRPRSRKSHAVMATLAGLTAMHQRRRITYSHQSVADLTVFGNKSPAECYNQLCIPFRQGGHSCRDPPLQDL